MQPSEGFARDAAEQAGSPCAFACFVANSKVIMPIASSSGTVAATRTELQFARSMRRSHPATPGNGASLCVPNSCNAGPARLTLNA